MDVRPQRPFRTQPGGKENDVPLAHQRVKSVANMKSIAATTILAAPNGLKVAPRRAAFGEVNTNLRQSHVGAEGIPKPSQVHVTNAGKENGPQGTSFQHPPQRAKAQGVVMNETRFHVAEFHPDKAHLAHLAEKSNPVGRKLSGAESLVQGGAKAFTNRKTITHVTEESRRHNGPERVTERFLPEGACSEAPKRHPRHYMSQPQLKKEPQPVLRRTVSRQLNDVKNAKPLVVLDDNIVELPYEDALEELLEINEAEGVALENSRPYVAPEAHHHQQINTSRPSNDRVEVGLEIVRVMQQQLARERPATPPPEPEEYWDEEDGDLDDDQGYTTAHSYRSLGENTTGGLTLVVAPKVTARVLQELELAKIAVEATRNPEEIDEENWDVSMVAEYGDEIFTYMRELEMRMSPDPHYMDIQTEIQWSMRSILIDWVVQVHHRFSLLPETLFLTVNYIDRFLSQKVVSVAKLQLVGATAIFIAAKYEEINCPSVNEIIFMVDNGFTAEEILKAERFMLSMLQFELGWPGPMSFLRRISKADDYDLETRTLAKYFLEVTIMDERFVGSPPSFLAAGAHCLSRLMLKKGDWSQAHTHWSGYTWSQLRPLVTLLLDCCQYPDKHHQAVFEKYVDRRYKRASSYVQEQIMSGFRLPYQASQHLLMD